MWEFWAAVTEASFQGLFNDLGNALTIMLSNESSTLVGPQNGTASVEGDLAGYTPIPRALPFAQWFPSRSLSQGCTGENISMPTPYCITICDGESRSHPVAITRGRIR